MMSRRINNDFRFWQKNQCQRMPYCTGVKDQIVNQKMLGRSQKENTYVSQYLSNNNNHRDI